MGSVAACPYNKLPTVYRQYQHIHWTYMLCMLYIRVIALNRWLLVFPNDDEDEDDDDEDADDEDENDEDEEDENEEDEDEDEDDEDLDEDNDDNDNKNNPNKPHACLYPFYPPSQAAPRRASASGARPLPDGRSFNAWHNSAKCCFRPNLSMALLHWCLFPWIPCLYDICLFVHTYTQLHKLVNQQLYQPWVASVWKAGVLTKGCLVLTEHVGVQLYVV